MTLSETGILVSICLGLYGAVLSTFNLIVQRREKVRRLRVSIELGSTLSTDGSPESDEQVKIEAANIGHQKVTLAVLSIKYKQRGSKARSIMLSKVSFLPTASPRATANFPYELDPGKNFQTVIRVSTLQEALKKYVERDVVKIRGCYSDQTGKSFVSKWLCIDLPPKTQESPPKPSDRKN